LTNDSGIEPVGHRVLVFPTVVEEVTKGGIILTAEIRDRDQAGAETGVVVAVGPDAWKLDIYKKPWAAVGDSVCFARYAGKTIEGVDGKKYRLMNDEDILAIKKVEEQS